MTVLSACRLTCFQSPGDSFPRLQLKPTSPALLYCHCYQKADMGPCRVLPPRETLRELWISIPPSHFLSQRRRTGSRTPLSEPADFRVTRFAQLLQFLLSCRLPPQTQIRANPLSRFPSCIGMDIKFIRLLGR